MLKILLVDDDEGIRDITANHLEKMLGTKPIVAHSGNQAIQLLEQGQKFDIIVSDYYMPDGTGADLIKYLNERNIFALFVLFTSAINPEIQSNNYFLGIVEKIKLDELVSMIMSGVCGGFQRFRPKI